MTYLPAERVRYAAFPDLASLTGPALVIDVERETRFLVTSVDAVFLTDDFAGHHIALTSGYEGLVIDDVRIELDYCSATTKAQPVKALALSLKDGELALRAFANEHKTDTTLCVLCRGLRGSTPAATVYFTSWRVVADVGDETVVLYEQRGDSLLAHLI